MKEITEELWQRGLSAGYMPEDLERGYTIESDKEKAKGATFIKRIEVLEIFNSDEEAANYAEQQDGIKIIRDLCFAKGDPDYAYYIDTADNREKILDCMEKDAVGSVYVFSEELAQLKNYLKDMKNALDCLHISITTKKAYKLGKDYLLNLISNRISLYRKTMALKGKSEIKYEYRESKEKLRFGQTVHSFMGGDYRIIEIYRPDCMLLLNLTNGQFLVAEEIGAYYRYPEGEKMNFYNTDFGVKWNHQLFLQGRPSVINFDELYVQFGTVPKTNEDGEYEFEITETLKKIVKVKAGTHDEALDEVERRYKDSEIVLDADDYKGVVFSDRMRKPVIESQRIV